MERKKLEHWLELAKYFLDEMKEMRPEPFEAIKCVEKLILEKSKELAKIS